MRRRTWTKVVLGGAAVGIVLAFITTWIMRQTGKADEDPNVEKITRLSKQFDAHATPKPPPESINEMKELAAQGGDAQKNVATLLWAWLRRMHDDRATDEGTEYRDCANILLVADPAAAEEAVKSLRAAKSLGEKAFEVQFLTTIGQPAVRPVMAAFEEDARNAHDDFHLASLSVFPDMLAALGLDALPRLKGAIDHKDPAVRRQALRALAIMAHKWPERTVEAVGDVEKAFKDPIPSVRAFAALAWGEMAVPKTGRAALLKLLSDEDPHVRLAAAWALAKPGGDVNLSSVAVVVEAVLKGEAFKRTWWEVAESSKDLEDIAVWKSGGVGKYSYNLLFWEEMAAHVHLNLGPRLRLPPETIVELLKSCPHDGRHLITLLAAQASKDRLETTMPTLAKMVSDSDPAKRRKALLALGQLGKEVIGADALATIVAALDDRHGPTRWQAFLALMRLDPEAAKAKLPPVLDSARVFDQASATRKLTDLTKVSKWTGTIWRDCTAILVPITDSGPALDNKGIFHTPIDLDIKAENDRIDNVLFALSRTPKPLGKDAVPFLLSIWQDTYWPAVVNARHGEKALELLAREGPAAVMAVPHLIQASVWLYYDSLDPRHDKKLIHNTLVKIGEGSVPYLTKALLEESAAPALQLNILSVLQAYGPKAKDALPTLLEALGGPNEEVCGQAAATFGTIGAAATAAVPKLRKMLEGKNATQRRHAATALGQIGPAAKAAVPDLIKLLDDDNQEQWVVVKRALKGIGSDAVPALVEALRDTRPKVRLGAIETLEMMSVKDAQPALAELQNLADPNQPKEVRDRAESLIKKLQPKG